MKRLLFTALFVLLLGQSAWAYPVRSDWAANRWENWDHHWAHLTSGEHRGHFDSDWLASLSAQELYSLHADDHENRVKWQYVVRPGRAMVARRVPATYAPAQTSYRVASTRAGERRATVTRTVTTYEIPQEPIYSTPPMLVAPPVMVYSGLAYAAAPMAQQTRTTRTGGGILGGIFGGTSRSVTTVAPPNSMAFGARGYRGGYRMRACPGGMKCP